MITVSKLKTRLWSLIRSSSSRFKKVCKHERTNILIYILRTLTEVQTDICCPMTKTVKPCHRNVPYRLKTRVKWYTKRYSALGDPRVTGNNPKDESLNKRKEASTTVIAIARSRVKLLANGKSRSASSRTNLRRQTNPRAIPLNSVNLPPQIYKFIYSPLVSGDNFPLVPLKNLLIQF